MDEAKADLVRAWLLKAWHDVRSAQALASVEQPLFDTALYHCQQAAEKAIKGFMAYHNSSLDRTHDLRFLVQRAATFDKHMNTLQDDAELLTPYATQFRYPDDYREPSREEFERAFSAAERIWKHILSALPSALHPVVK